MNLSGGAASRVVEDLKAPPSTILVVEDEVLIRFVVAAYLRDCGFRVVEATSADEAIAVLEAPSTAVDLVFSDVNMPGSRDGFGLARWIREHRAGLPIILTSGIARTAELSVDLCELGPIEEKPYSVEDLASRIQRVLGVRLTA